MNPARKLAFTGPTAVVAGDHAFSSVPEALEELRRGRMVVVVDDADRENEGDITIAAQFVTPDVINFLAQHGRGLICLCLTEGRCRELSLEPMASRNESHQETAFTVSIDARDEVGTGISAADRARTVQVAINSANGPESIVRPGHVFPLKARAGGVLERRGHSEAAVDLARLAGLNPSGVICEILNEDGTMARVPDLVRFCMRHGLKVVRVMDLVRYRQRVEKLVERVSSARLPTVYGEFRAIVFREVLTEEPHIALVMGNIENQRGVLVRVHSECLTGDAFHSLRCDCGDQLDESLRQIAQRGSGMLIHMAEEGRGIGLVNKLRAYELQDRGLDTVDANIELGFAPDLRDYGLASQIILDLGPTSIQLLTNNPKKVASIEAFGLEVEQLPLSVPPNSENYRYLLTKELRLGHRFVRHGVGAEQIDLDVADVDRARVPSKGG